MRHVLVGIGLAVVLAGCGGSEDNDDPVVVTPPPVVDTPTDPDPVDPADPTDPDPDTTPNELTIDVSAPGGAVAQLEPTSLLQYAVRYLISPATAGITGLQPVTGATVELIRVDNDGNQVGDVLATGSPTSISGNYTLTIPAGVNLAGNLVVRVGTPGTTQIRAQVVQQEIHISPISEFVLQRFIANGADLENLTTTAVIELSGKVEEFDLTAGADMSEMLNALQAEVGQFADSAIQLLDASPLAAANIEGAYRNVAIVWGLHDNEGNEFNTYAVESWIADLELTAAGEGAVDLAVLGEEDAGFMLWTSGLEPNASYQLFYETEIDVIDETIPASYTSGAVLSIQNAFDESIEGDVGFRWPPSVRPYQKLLNSDTFVALSDDALVRYNTIDTDNDGVKDAVDPQQKSGDEVFRGFEFFLKKPVEAANSDLSGDYGRVYIGTYVNEFGYTDFEAETSLLSFDGNGLVDAGEADHLRLERHPDGTVNSVADVAEAEAGLTYTLESDGSFSEIGGQSTNAFTNDTFDVLVMSDFYLSDNLNETDSFYSDVSHSLTLAVKLPASAPSIAEKVYRVIGVENELQDSSISLASLRFATQMTMTSQNTATIDAHYADLELDFKGADLIAGSGVDEDLAADVIVGSNGATVITVEDEDGVFLMEGFLNEDGSFGVFRSQYIPNGEEPISLGVAVLIEIEA